MVTGGGTSLSGTMSELLEERSTARSAPKNSRDNATLCCRIYAPKIKGDGNSAPIGQSHREKSQAHAEALHRPKLVVKLYTSGIGAEENRHVVKESLKIVKVR